MKPEYTAHYLEFVNKEEKQRFWGLLSPVNEETEMASERIQECLDGIESAVTEELESHGFDEEEVSSRGIENSEREIRAENSDVEIEVSAIVEDTRKGSWEENYGPRQSVKPGKVSAVARHRGEKVKNGKITAHYRFESDSEDYKALYNSIAQRLTQLTEELDLSKGDFFGRMPQYKSVMS